MQIRRKITKPQSGKYTRKNVKATTWEKFVDAIYASPLEFHLGKAICHPTRTVYRWVQG